MQGLANRRGILPLTAGTIAGLLEACNESLKTRSQSDTKARAREG